MLLLHMAREYAADPDAWPLAPRFDPIRRWYHRLAIRDEAEVWLLTWLPGQGTDLHDHGGSAGAFVVVSGELTEEVARPHGLRARRRREVVVSGELTEEVTRPHGLQARRRREGAFGPDHVHRIVNDGPRPAVSVHVYGPALKTMRRYRMENERLVVATVERAGVNW